MVLKFRSLLIILLLLSELTFAAEYYCDPVNGNINNNGSKNSPWPKLEDVFNSGKTFQPGDVIWLLTGYHGNVYVNGVNAGYVTIKNYQDNSPKLSMLTFGTSSVTSGWAVEGLIIGAEYNGTFHRNTLLFTSEITTDITIKNTSIFTKDDISEWTITDWNTKISNGVVFKGSFCSIENSTVKNIRTGIQFEGVNCTAFSNKVMNFAGDGMRGLADNGVFEYNIVQDNYVIDDNHDDGFQSWTNEGGIGKGTLNNIVLTGNIFISYTNPDRNFLGPMQGIFGTDGMFENFMIENNVVIVDHWHGISLYGAVNSRIINNTVLDNYFGTTYPDHPDPGARGPLGPSWIRIANHKNGTKSTGNTIRNNITNQIVLEPGSGIQDHNLLLGGKDPGDYDLNFIDWKNFDFRLKQTSAAVDSGSEILAPPLDADKISRPVGSAFDIGAYEYTGSLGVDDERLTSELVLYPNLNTTGEFRLRSSVFTGDLRVTLYDLSGRKIETIYLEGTKGVSRFSFHKFKYISDGFYLVKVTGISGETVFRIYKPS